MPVAQVVENERIWVEGVRRGRIATAARLLSWGLLIGLALYFVATNALRYLAPHGRAAGRYFGLAPVIRLHVAAGMAALFAGLAQFRTGSAGARRRVHRWMGRAYLVSIGVATLAASELLAREGRHNWVATSGLAALAVAWVGTSSLAWLAIRRGHVGQHREWMARSYTVTFAFVTYRLLVNALAALQVGADNERRALASWCCWAVPLLGLELVLQGRKILAGDRRRGARGVSRATAAVVVAALALGSSACIRRVDAHDANGSSGAAAVTSLRQTIARWTIALESGAVDEIVRYHADDVVAMYAKTQPTIGRAANRAAWDSAVARPGYRHPVSTDTV